LVFVGQLFSITTAEEITSNTKNAKVKAFLEEFKIVFGELMYLPPIRKLDNIIPLIRGAKPAKIRPYRSSFILKEEIEKLVKDMLSNGVIR